jgi:hypothetical protein
VRAQGIEVEDRLAGEEAEALLAALEHVQVSAHLPLLVHRFGPDHVMVGTDAPFIPGQLTGLAGLLAGEPALAHSIAISHPLVDGTKRLALMAVLLFQGLIDHRLTVTEGERVQLKARWARPVKTSTRFSVYRESVSVETACVGCPGSFQPSAVKTPQVRLPASPPSTQCRSPVFMRSR